jgi:heat shock protein HspQ
MFKEDEEVLSCTEIANECRHDPLFDVVNEDGETMEYMTLSDILELVDDSSEEAIAGFRDLIQASLEEQIEFCGLSMVRVG